MTEKRTTIHKSYLKFVNDKRKSLKKNISEECFDISRTRMLFHEHTPQ